MKFYFRRLWSKAPVLAALFLSSLYSHSWAFQSYGLTDLGTLPTGGVSKAWSVNNNGVVAGEAGQGFSQHAVKWESGVIQDIGTLPGGSNSVSYGLNSSGTIVGDSETYTNTHAFYYQNGQMHDLAVNDIYSSAKSINSSGAVVGVERTSAGSLHAHEWSNGNSIDLGVYGSDTQSFAVSINSNGTAAGASGGVFNSKAVIWQNGTIHLLGSLGGFSSYANAINDLDEVIGYSYLPTGDLHGFLYQAGIMHDLSTLGGSYSHATALNNLTQVVGYSETSAHLEHAFIYDDGVMRDLNELVDSSGINWSLQDALGINDSGQIVGYGTYNGSLRAYLLTPSSIPVPEPQNVVVISFGLLVLTYNVRKR